MHGRYFFTSLEKLSDKQDNLFWSSRWSCVLRLNLTVRLRNCALITAAIRLYDITLGLGCSIWVDSAFFLCGTELI